LMLMVSSTSEVTLCLAARKGLELLEAFKGTAQFSIAYLLGWLKRLW